MRMAAMQKGMMAATLRGTQEHAGETESLVVLMGDTTTAKDRMVGSCSDLNSTLSGTQQEVIESLKTLQQNLSSWLGEVQTNMANTQAILTRQQASLDEFKGAIATSSHEFTAKNEQFIAVQKEFSTSLITDMSELKSDITTSVSSFQAGVQQQAAQNKAALKAKSEALQKAMSELLGDLVDEQDQHNDSVVTVTNNFSTAVISTAGTAVDKIVTTTSRASTNMLELNSALSENVQQSSMQFTEMVQGSQSIRQEIETEVKNVADNVGEKRAFLDETTSSLSGSVSASISRAHEEVQQTSSTAEKMVDNVTDASEKMKTSCAESMNSFTDFLSGKGEEINAGLITHFRELERTLTSDMDIVQGVAVDNAEFVELTKSSVLQPTGTTPVKKATLPLRPVESTRCHEDIKGETRSTLSHKRSLGEVTTSSTEQNSGVRSDPPSECFMSPSKAAKLTEQMEQTASVVIDAENLPPSNLAVNLDSASLDEDDDDDQSVSSKSSAASGKSASTAVSRNSKRASSIKSQLASPKIKRASSKSVIRSSSTRSVL
jgi:hypothetical protein